jgi:hypothetical protein
MRPTKHRKFARNMRNTLRGRVSVLQKTEQEFMRNTFANAYVFFLLFDFFTCPDVMDSVLAANVMNGYPLEMSLFRGLFNIVTHDNVSATMT